MTGEQLDELAKKSKDLTTSIYQKVFIDIHGHLVDGWANYIDLRNEVMYEGLYKAEETDVAYRNEVNRLPTKDLELIIKAHKLQVFGRAQVTIDSMLNELMERSMLKKDTSV